MVKWSLDKLNTGVAWMVKGLRFDFQGTLVALCFHLSESPKMYVKSYP